MKRNKDKISLGKLKGKSITTSVPTISIKFHANAEQLEELYGSDDERKNYIDDKALSVAAKEKGSSSTGNIQETTEPLELSKRSNSTEVPTTFGDSSPPSSDPWKFFTEIKGKIAKSVEDKMNKKKQVLDDGGKRSKSNNNSDSEELSESSISKTAGITSTTEGAEMSSDDESLRNENSMNMFIPQTPALPITPTLRQRFRLLKAKTESHSAVSIREGTISLSGLAKIDHINSEASKEEIESGVDALLESQIEQDQGQNTLSSLERCVDNIGIDADGSVVVVESDNKLNAKTLFAPKGFFDFRMEMIKEEHVKNSYLLTLIIIGISSIAYLLIQKYSSYLAGMIAGIFITIFSYFIRNKFSLPSSHSSSVNRRRQQNRAEFCVPPIKEYQPVVKYEGWMNEFPDNYDPTTYHISLTQPVFLKLEGSLLKISNTKAKIPKRASWNENIAEKSITHHRIYNLMGAKVSLLPVGLAKVRQWSKKYPIYVALSNDQLKFEDDLTTSKDTDDEISPAHSKKNAGFSFRKKASTVSLPQRFSKLYAEQDNFYTDLEYPTAEVQEPRAIEDLDNKSEQDEDSNLDENSWSNCTLDDSPTETRIYLFARTDRDKECWFRRLSLAAASPINKKKSSIDSILNETDFISYMSSITNHLQDRENMKQDGAAIDVNWVNALLGRLIFDCLCDEDFTAKIKERIRRKLAAIHLPYFIEELSITELNLGKTCPLLKNVGNPSVDERGLWIDVGLTYEGLAVLTLTTKLNLMKLKQPNSQHQESQNSRSAIFHSDVDDSAESSSDDETPTFLAENVLTPPVNKSKKLMKMVDKIAESKFFQAATENKYIKRAMEGVSNTDLRLKVEVLALTGTLVINIPPPPSDRIWLGFRPVPELLLSAHPIVGERNITFMHITGLIEKKLVQEFQKLLVIPNMEDLYIPFMMSKLPTA